MGNRRKDTTEKRGRGRPKKFQQPSIDALNVSNSKLEYKMNCCMKEDHGKPIYDCKLFNENFLENGEPRILATVGSNRVSVYRLDLNGGMKLLQAYVDEDKQEDFWTCAWTLDKLKNPLLAVAGKKGMIRIFSISQKECLKTLQGHGRAVYHVDFHPKDPNLLYSTSKDKSIYLWNIETDICVAVFGGAQGHVDDVLSADINAKGTLMLSTGLDNFVKVWNLNHPECVKAIKLSYFFDENSQGQFPTWRDGFPLYSTNSLHFNYVDCGKWFGDLIISKDCDNNIYFWKGGTTFQNWDELPTESTDYTIFRRVEHENCSMWFQRFTVGKFDNHIILVVGNDIGEMHVYNMKVDDPADISRTTVLKNLKCTTAIRQTAISRDGSIVTCICDDSTVWRWDIVNE